jgi:ribosomal protein S18 acetylase RimI-like enzyme
MADRPGEYFEDRLRQVEAGGGSRLLFARQDGRLVGMIGSSRQDGAHVVNAFYVQPSSRGQGVGKALLNELLTRIAADGLPTAVTLHVNKAQPEAIAVYRSAGFIVTGELTETMGDGLSHQVVAMTLSIFAK